MNKIIICDKNKKLIKKIKRLDLNSDFYEVVVSDKDDVFDVKKDYPNARIVTASNPKFKAGGGLDKVLADAYPKQWKEAKEFHRTKDLLFTVTCDDKIQSNKDIVLRALVGVSAYSWESDLILTGLGTGIAGLPEEDFVELLERFLQRNFNNAKLNHAKLNDAELNNTRLNNTKLNYAELNDAELNYAELDYAKLNYARLNNTRLNNAKLNYARLNYARLNCARLNYAELNYAELNYEELNYTELSGCEGVINFSPSEWMKNNFVATKEGYVVYKAIGNTIYFFPDKWTKKKGSVLTEVVNSNVTNDCGCGVNFGTKKWVKKNYPDSELWECLIPWERLADVIVPIHTDGKARTRWLQLIKKVK